MTKGELSCLQPECNRIRNHRGICEGCAYKIRKRIKAGETTEEEQITLGFMLPRQNYNRKWNNTLRMVKGKWEH